MTRHPSSARLGRFGLPWAVLAGCGRLLAGLAHLASRRPGAAFVALVVVSAVASFSWNALVEQPTRHPAPLFAEAKPAAKPSLAPAAPVEASRREPAPVPPLPTPRPDVTSTAAIRAAPQAPAQAPRGDTIGALIRGGEPARPPEPKAKPARTDAVEPARPAEPKAKPARVEAVQKALAKLGYGPIAVDGVMGSETRRALERFERERKLPVTGALSPRTTKRLASASGIAID